MDDIFSFKWAFKVISLHACNTFYQCPAVQAILYSLESLGSSCNHKTLESKMSRTDQEIKEGRKPTPLPRHSMKATTLESNKSRLGIVNWELRLWWPDCIIFMQISSTRNMNGNDFLPTDHGDQDFLPYASGQAWSSKLYICTISTLLRHGKR